MKKLLFFISAVILCLSTAFTTPNTLNIQKYPEAIMTYCGAADSVFSKWDSLGHSASQSYKNIVNDVISHLISAGEWYNKDVFYGEFAEDTTQALTDWRHPFTRKASTEKYYSSAFIPGVGWDGNGAGSATTGFRINLHYNPGDGGTYNFIQNNNSFGYYSAGPGNTNETKVGISALDGSAVGNELYTLVTSFGVSGKNNCGTVSTITNYTSIGMVANERTASNAYEVTKWGYDMYSGGAKPTTASSAVVNVPWYEFCRNTAGTKTFFSSNKHSYSFAGSSCDLFKFNSIIEQYALIPLGIAPTTRYIINGNSWTSNGVWVKRFMVNNGYDYDILVRGISGKTTPQLLADATSTIFNKQKPYLTREVYAFQEYTNDFVAVSSNWNTAYSHTTIYLDSANNYFPNAEFVLAEMPPRNSASIDTTKRQHYTNDTAWNTLNGHLRLHARSDGWTRTVPVGKSSIIGKTGCELNTAEYLADKIHLVNTAAHGYNVYGDLMTDSIK